MRLLPAVDADGDTLPDLWERELGLSTENGTGDYGADGDPEGDGLRNGDELLRRSHPRGAFHTYLTLLNPSTETTTLTVTYVGGTA